MSLPPGRLIALAILIGGLMVSVLVACGTQDTQPQPPAQPKPSDRTQTQQHRAASIDRRQYQAFPALRHPAQPLPAAISKYARGERELFPHLARQLPATFGYRNWAVPGRGSLCLLVHTPNTYRYRTIDLTCDHTKQALARHGISTTYLHPPTAPGDKRTRTIIGFADNHAQVAVIRTGRARTTVPVTDGFYATRDHARRAPSEIIIR